MGGGVGGTPVPVSLCCPCWELAPPLPRPRAAQDPFRTRPVPNQTRAEPVPDRPVPDRPVPLPVYADTTATGDVSCPVLDLMDGC